MLLCKLARKVRKHTAGNLILKGLDVNAHVLRIHQAVLEILLTDRTEIVSDLRKLIKVETRIIFRTAESFDHNFSRGLRCSQRERADRSVENICACLDRFHIGHGSTAGCIMRMHLKRKARSFLQSCHELCCSLRNKKSGHILDADRIRAHVLDLLGDVLPVIERIGITKCVGKRDLRFRSFFLCSLDACLKVPQVIQAVENTDHIDSVRD